MKLLRRLAAYLHSKRRPKDSHSELLTMARAMHPEASDSELVAHLLENAPQDAPPLSDPLSWDGIDVAAHLAKEFENIARKLEHNLRRLRGKKFPETQKQIVLAGSVKQLNRLYALADGLATCVDDPQQPARLRQRARQLETEVVAIADSLGDKVVLTR